MHLVRKKSTFSLNNLNKFKRILFYNFAHIILKVRLTKTYKICFRNLHIAM